MTYREKDTEYIKRCFELAERGKGKVSPNPLVGSVIVKGGKVISEGWHKEYGGLHAEANAVKDATADLDGATLYCNLEPCCHTNKQTPPCTPLIINSGIKRIVISNIDPEPSVAGKGVSELKNEGIEVTTGILEKEGKYLNRFYFKRVIANHPYVTIKIAQSLDGKITSQLNKKTQITGKKAVEFVHQQRAVYDAILVGANTVRIDNPRLDVRFVKGRNPLRIILDSDFISPSDAAVFNNRDQDKTWLITGKNSNKNKISELRKKGVKIVNLPFDESGIINIDTLLEYLGSEKINSLFVEGGANVFSNFISSGLFDDIFLLQAPVLFGKGLDSNSVKSDDLVELELDSVEKLGNDIKVIMHNKNSSIFI